MKMLAAPICLDALVLPHPKVVKDAMADYSRLPYTDGTQDYNPDIPYVGEAMLNHPFHDKNLLLRAGTHLHWSFPQGLSKTIGIRLIKKSELVVLESQFPTAVTSHSAVWDNTKNYIWDSLLIASHWIKPLGEDRGSVLNMDQVDQTIFNQGINFLQAQAAWPTGGAERFVNELMKLLNKPLGAEYPAVPDIWLISRKENGMTDKTWIVESHYIDQTQTAEAGNQGAVTVPFHDDRHDNKTPPFRFMGRQLEGKADWGSGKLRGAQYLHEITAVGYNPQAGSKGFAEPTFAAFYPNSMSVFGFHDPETLAPRDGLTYEVLGLYANPENDYLKIFLGDFANRHAGDADYFAKLNEVLLSEFLWRVPVDTPIDNDAAIPAQAVLFGKAIPKPFDVPQANQVEIAVGNTGTEALSAYLATKVAGDKRKGEELLEAIQFASRLQNTVLDIGHKFRETRHDKGFTAFPGGILWNLKPETMDGVSADESNEEPIHQAELSAELAGLLDEVNALQSTFEKAGHEVVALRRQLFSDWYKYMVNAYPPIDNKTMYFEPDEVMDYIRKESIPPLQEKLHALGTLAIAQDERGRFKEAMTFGREESIASQLAARLKVLAHEVDAFNGRKGDDGKSWKDKGKSLALRQVAAPRYWRANDPVILFAEQPTADQVAALRNDRFAAPGISGIAGCKLLDNPAPDAANLSFDDGMKLFELVSRLFAETRETGNTESTAIWNPFMMEWEVEFLPAHPGSNEETAARRYEQEYINRHYRLNETDPDLSLAASTDIFQNANIYTGSTILTPNAGIRLGIAIQQFIEHYGAGQSPETLQMLDDARKYLDKTDVLSQSLGGFHDALLMQKQTRQLDIADPLGFPEYQAFADKGVAPLVGKYNLTAPQPLDDYNPIRSGLLRILSLRLIDSFGQTVDFEAPDIVTTETLSVEDTISTIHLKPRLSQPARLNFRLLSAASGEQEMNAAPASTPICGWLLPNELDRSIQFYDRDGSALGALTMNAANPWRPAPDSTRTTFIDSINNLYLRRVARYLFDRQRESIAATGTTENSFLHHFINTLNNALENVDPENFTDHMDLAVLIGKPVAVVRAKLKLELEGPPSTDQSWTQLDHELHGHGRATDDFTKVKFPIRLGEYKQLNDGLAGYWIEAADGQLGADYFSSEGGEIADPHIKTYIPGGQPLNIFQAIDDEPLCVTMLADPRGKIHIVSGIFPIKTITIPKDQYADSMKRMAVTFLTAPVLSTADHLKISLPKEPGFEWTWLEKNEDRQWQEIPQTALIARSVLDAGFPDQPGLWDRLVTKKWLQPLAADPLRALITTAVHRAFPPNAEADPDPFPVDVGRRLDNFFDTYGKRIEPFDWLASFGGPQLIREGWLQLREVQAGVDSADS